MVGNFRVPNAGTQVSAAPTGVTGNVSSKKRRRNSQANSQLQPISNTNIENSSSLNSQPPDNIFIGNPFEDPHSMRMPPNSQPQALPQSDHGMSGGMMPSSNSPMRNSPSFSPFHNNGNGQMIEGGGGPPISMDRMPHPNMSSVPISSALPSDPSNRMLNVNGNVPHSNPGVSPNFFNPSMNNMCDPMSGMIPGGVPMNVGGGGGSQMNPNGPSPMMLMNRGMPPYMNNHNHPDGMNSGGPLPPPPHPQMFGNGPLPPVNNGPGMSPMSGDGGVPNNGNGNGNFPPNSSNMSQMGGNPQMNGPMPPSRFMDQVDNIGSNSPSHHPTSMVGGGGPFGGNGMGGPMMRSSGSLHDRMMMGGGGPINNNNNRAQQLPPYCEQPGAGSIRPSHAVSPSMNVMNNGHNSPLNPGMSPSQHNPPPGGPMPCPMPMSSPGLQNHVMMGPNGPRPCSSPMTQHEMQNIPNRSSSPYTNSMAPTPPSGMMMMPGAIPNHANSPSHRPSGPPHPSPHMVGPGPGSGSPHGGNIGNTAPLGPHSGPHPNPTVPCGPHSGNNGPASCPPGNTRHIPPDMSPSHCGGGGGGGGGLMPPNSLSPMPTDHTGRPLAFPPGMCPPPGMMHPHHPLSNEKVYPIGQPMVFNPQNPNAPPIYPCGICHREVHDNDQAILCESGCNFWFHRICTGLSQSAFHFLTQEIYAEWVCDKCFTQKDIPLVKFKP